MSFNQSKFNLAKFNISSQEEMSSLRFVTARGLWQAKRPLMKRSSKLFLRKADVIFGAAFVMKVSVSLKLKPVFVTSNATMLLMIKTNLALLPARAVWNIGKSLFIRTFEISAIDLFGLVIGPGEAITIDMDQITVEKNGINVIEYWQTGSKPFYLVNGENVISYYDAGDRREAELQIIWRERWL